MVCGLSTRKMRTPCATQYSITPASAEPHLAPLRRLEVEGVDVLVLLRRVLGVLDAAVGALAEPLRVLASPTGGRARTGRRCRARSRCRVRRRAAPGGWKSASVPSSPRIASCPPSAAPMAHGLPTSSALRVERVVAALAARAADRVDGREVEHVEAHALHVGQPGLAVGEGAVALRLSADAERGKNSYQAEKRARSRSTVTRQRRQPGVRMASGRGGAARSRCAASSMPMRLQLGRRRRRRRQRPRAPGAQARSSLRSSPAGARCAAAAISAAPPSAAMRTSSASTRRAKSLRHDRNGSTQAHTVYSHAPSASTAKAARQRSLPSGCIGVFCHLRGAGAAPQQRAGDHVVAVGEAVGLDLDGVADARA